MTPVPPEYQRVINPWQNRKEVRLAVKFLEQMFKHIPEERRSMLRLDYPERDWSKPA